MSPTSYRAAPPRTQSIRLRSSVSQRTRPRSTACDEAIGSREQVMDQLWRHPVHSHENAVITGVMVGNVIDVGSVFHHEGTLSAVDANQERSRLRGFVGGHTGQQFRFSARPLYLERRTSIGGALLNAGKGGSGLPYGIESNSFGWHDRSMLTGFMKHAPGPMQFQNTPKRAGWDGTMLRRCN